MPDKKKISELQSVVLGNSDYFAVAHDNDGVRESGKVSTTEIGQKVNGGIEYSGIHKTIIDHQNPIAALNDLQNYIIDSVLPSDSVSASLATIPDGADDVPLKSWKSTIVPIQASGTPSPENPLPITGRTQIVATQGGPNLYDYSTDTTNKYYSSNGGEASSTSWRCSDYIEVTPGSKVVAKGLDNGSVSGSHYLCVYKQDKSFSRSIQIYANTDVVVNVASDEYYIRTSVRKANNEYLTARIFEVIVEKTISLGQTVYGGELNITTGEGISDWINIDSYNGETISEPWLCSEAEYAPGTTPPTGSQVVYKATSGTQFTTTAEEFRTLKGDNGFYTDCGDSTVEYRADIALYIAKSLGGGNRSLGLMMSPSPTPTEETREEETEQEEVDNGNNQR